MLNLPLSSCSDGCLILDERGELLLELEQLSNRLLGLGAIALGALKVMDPSRDLST